MGPKAEFFPAVDGLRTIAVALVFGIHFFPAAMPYGWMGVQVFFVLSGFLITGILFDTAFDEHRYRNFYARRTLRIFPLYYGFLITCGLILLFVHGHGPQSFWLWWLYLENLFWIVAPGASDLLVTGHNHGFAAIAHFWSLAVEEQFYLVWPPLVFFFARDRRRLMQLCVALIMARMVLATAAQIWLPSHILAGGVIYRMLPTQCDGFLLGGLLALWLRGKPSEKLRQKAGPIAAFALALYAALLAFVSRFPALILHHNAFDYTAGFQATIGMHLCNAVSLCVLFAALQPSTWVFRLCALAPMRSLGRVSYGLYVFHLPIYVGLGGGFLTYMEHRFDLRASVPAFHAAVATVVTLTLSYASFYLYEKRFLQLKDRFISRQGRAVVRVAPLSL